ncbi:MAG: dTMP kinase [Candidatus Eisenbacteria bacterium]|uniref:Thymidylate kinase n=1 Tax=Eiseniibacteriota bacterium TaxID=2212470 RepID=A0A956SCC6_UNCEI|nr:dTMP kinase [Candidatus Eisenbacteria bacterium]
MVVLSGSSPHSLSWLTSRSSSVSTTFGRPPKESHSSKHRSRCKAGDELVADQTRGSEPSLAGTLGQRFLSFEGTEGSGKTTQVRRLQDELERIGWRTLLVREPGGTELSERVRTLLLDPATGVVAPWAELALYVAARAQLVAEKIRPALASGHLVLADRYGDSSVVYQGVARGIPVGEVEQLNDWATSGLRPGLTVLFDLDPEVGLSRVSSRGSRDRLESEPLEFHHKVRNGYLALAARSPERVRVLDASRPEEEVWGELLSIVLAHLETVGSETAGSKETTRP